jgi:hypothetical protein
MPGNVEIDLGIDSDGHIRKARERARKICFGHHGLKAVAKLKQKIPRRKCGWLSRNADARFPSRAFRPY